MKAREIEENRGCWISVSTILEVEPTLAHPQVMNAILGSVKSLGLDHTKLPSRAGHDSQNLGRRFPMGMVFIPSAGGISHSPDEFTSLQDCYAGIEVLYNALLRLDREL